MFSKVKYGYVIKRNGEIKSFEIDSDLEKKILSVEKQGSLYLNDMLVLIICYGNIIQFFEYPPRDRAGDTLFAFVKEFNKELQCFSLKNEKGIIPNPSNKLKRKTLKEYLKFDKKIDDNIINRLMKFCNRIVV